MSQYLFLYPKKLFSYCPLPSQVHSGWSYWIDIFKFNLYCFAFDFEMLGPKHFWVFEVLFLLAAQGSWKKTYINPLYYPFVFSHHFDPFFASCNRSSFVVEWCHVYDPWAYATRIRMRWGRVGLEASKYVNMMIYTEFQVPLIIFNKLIQTEKIPIISVWPAKKYVKLWWNTTSSYSDIIWTHAISTQVVLKSQLWAVTKLFPQQPGTYGCFRK